MAVQLVFFIISLARKILMQHFTGTLHFSFHIKSNQIKSQSNQITIKSNQITNQIKSNQIKSNQIKSNHNHNQIVLFVCVVCVVCVGGR